MTDPTVLMRCRSCDDFGRLPDRSECGHTEVYAAIARAGAAKARAAIRPAPAERSPV